VIRKLWDSSEIQEAAELFNNLLKSASTAQPAAPATRTPTPGREFSQKLYRGDLLNEALASMCRRGEFSGAVLADNNGLALAVYNSPVDEGVLAAFTSVLGKSLTESGRLLKQPNANNISMDINYFDKLVLRKFLVDDTPYFLMVISPQHVDERAELELSLNSIAAILTTGV
jgi:hypothetical protein